MTARKTKQLIDCYKNRSYKDYKANTVDPAYFEQHLRLFAILKTKSNNSVTKCETVKYKTKSVGY